LAAASFRATAARLAFSLSACEIGDTGLVAEVVLGNGRLLAAVFLATGFLWGAGRRAVVFTGFLVGEGRLATRFVTGFGAGTGRLAGPLRRAAGLAGRFFAAGREAFFLR
jgi:hypothetical protein